MILRIARDHVLGGAAADLPGVAGRDGARIDRERLRPVGSTSSRPREGAPAGPGGTKRPSSAASSPRSSAGPRPSPAQREKVARSRRMRGAA